MTEYVVFVFPKLWTYPKPLDPNDITLEEQGWIEVWQDTKDKIEEVVNQITPNSGWELSGDFTDIVVAKDGIRLIKSGDYYVSMWFELDRMMVDQPSGWIVSEMAKLTGPGLKFQGFIAEDIHAELVERGYEIVGREIDV